MASGAGNSSNALAYRIGAAREDEVVVSDSELSRRRDLVRLERDPLRRVVHRLDDESAHHRDTAVLRSPVLYVIGLFSFQVAIVAG